MPKKYPPFTKEQQAKMDWYNKASGRAEVTESPIDYGIMLGVSGIPEMGWKLATTIGRKISVGSVAKLGVSAADDLGKFASSYIKGGIGVGVGMSQIVKPLIDEFVKYQTLKQENIEPNIKHKKPIGPEQFALGGTVMPKKPTNLFRTDKPAYADSVLTANKDLDWVKRLYGVKSRKSIPTPQDVEGWQPGMTSTHLISDDGNGFVYPRVVNQNGKLVDMGANAEQYARETNTGIQLPKEQGSWFAAGYVDDKGVRHGYKSGAGVLGNYQPDRLYKYGTSSSGVNAEVEGDEVLEYPNGQMEEVQGASHEQGGVDATLPEGTKIYSDRLKVGDYTMAERKKYRSNQIKKLIGKFGDVKDGLTHNTLKRNLDFLKMQEQHDLAIQEAAQASVSQQGTPQYAGGTGPYGIEDINDPYSQIYTQRFNPGYLLQDQSKGGYNDPYSSTSFSTTDHEGSPMPRLDFPKAVASRGVNPVSSLKQPSNRLTPRAHPEYYGAPEGTELPPNEGSGFTAGDWVGLGSMALGNIMQAANTISNAKATKPAQNYWRGFNATALQANAEATDQLGYNQDIDSREMNRTLNVATNDARARTRNSAMGVGTNRALDLATDLGVNEMKMKGANELSSNYGRQKLALLSTKTQLLSEQDRAWRAGQDKTDEINQANLDNFYTNFGENLASMSTSGQYVGGMMNQSQQNRDFLSMLPDTNKWGIGYERDENGKLIQTFRR